MNASSLILIMKMESRSSEKRLKALRNIVADNPWFSIGQQLLAIETKKLDKDDFEKNLSKAAVYSIYRDFLYYRLCDPSQNYDNAELQNFNDDEISEDDQVKQESTTEEQSENEQNTKEKVNDENPITEEKESEEPKKEDEQTENEQETEEKINDENSITEEKEKEPKKEDEQTENEQ
ncbi:MAG: hypothetical protein LBT27_01760, partial [Prevotellaceae bacterium]|nr:hypothetical protein [Prevotellaceae bacterium]